METPDRTLIYRLHVEGYRSIRDLTLNNIPSAAVFYGENGSGKSNILRAARLGCAALALRRGGGRKGGFGRGEAITLNDVEAAKHLGLRSEDFHRPEATRIRIEMTWVVGQRELRERKAPSWLLASLRGALAFEFSVVLELAERASIELWVEKARFAQLPRGTEQARTWVKELDSGCDDLVPEIATLEREIKQLTGSSFEPDQRLLQEKTQQLQRVRSDATSDWVRFQSRFVVDFLGQQAISFSDAYRLPAGVGDSGTGSVEEKLHQRFLSPSPETARSIKRLQGLLGRAGLFGGGAQAPQFRAVLSEERRVVHVTHPSAGDLPLKSFGTGEQQVFLLLAQRVLDSSPVVQLEEPEAHLHTALMRPLAALLLSAVQPRGEAHDAPIDQLWIATHHHLFAIDREFFEVTLKNGETVVERKNRAQAAQHFYEPGALWDALRSLLDHGLSPDTVIFRTADGNSVTAQQILESEKTVDQALFKEWVVQTTEQVVLSMTAKAKKVGSPPA